MRLLSALLRSFGRKTMWSSACLSSSGAPMKTIDLRPHTSAPASAGRSPTIPGVYPTPEARETLHALYDAKLAQWPVAFEDHYVSTRYGLTHVVSSGDPAAPPLVLVHPAGCAAFIWRRMIEPLSERYRVHALDTIGDVGKSVLSDASRFPKRGSEYSDWLSDVFDRLGIDAAVLVGWSMGGWIATNFAADRPARVQRLALLGPMGLPSWPVTMRVLFRLASSAILPSPSKKEKLIAWAMGSDPIVREEVRDWMEAVIDTRCAPRLGNPFPVSREKLRAISAPTLVVLGGRDGPIGDARQVAARARSHLRNVEVDVLPDNTHAMGIEAADRIARRLLAFCSR
jgi:pimeloyl-ACP methyl ester carboxylesterase